jgi:type IV pilus assembly protein PilC
MKLFYWRGNHTSGRSLHGALQARDRSSASAQLRSQQIEPVRMVGLPSLQRQPTETQITLLIRQLSALLSTGLTLARSLQGILQGTRDRTLRALIHSLLGELQQGRALSAILAEHPALFDPFLIHLVRAGERSSQLPLLLQRAAEYRERLRILKRQSWKAISYPLGVLLLTLAITLFLFLQVVPQFESLFAGLGGALPPLTQHLLSLTHALQQHALELLAALVLIPTLLLLLYRSSSTLQRRVDQLVLRMPLLGTTLQEILVARTARTLAILQQAAIPLHHGLESAAEISSLLPFRESMAAVNQAVHQGIPLSTALQQQHLFPPIALQMVHAGEESGELAEMLERLAGYYESEVEHRIQQLTALLEPLLILLIGSLVGTLAIALYQPIFQMGQHL